MSEHGVEFVFRDAGGQRWKRVRRALTLFGGVAGLSLALLGLGVTLRPALPSLNLPLSGHQLRQERHRLLLKSGLLPAPAALAPALPAPSGAGPAGPNRPEVTGFYVNWDDNSFSSLKAHLGALTELDAEWLHLDTTPAGLQAGGLREDDHAKTHDLLDYLHAVGSAVRVVPLVNNYNSARQAWDGAAVGTLLHDPARRRRLEDALLAYVARVHGGGLMVDFENLPDAAQPDLLSLLGELHARMAPAHLRLNAALPLDDDSFDYAAYGRVVDRVHLMAYDQHDDTAAAGPVAAQGWLQDRLKARLASLPASRVVLDLGNYGYDWAPGSAAQELSFQDALTTAGESSASPQLDPGSLNPTYSYDDDAGRTHTVWYLDAASTFDQAQLARRLGVTGLALWRMGTEDPRVWKVLNPATLAAPLGAETARALEPLPYGYDLSYRGDGELLRVVSEPRDGQRALTFDAARGLITGERPVRLAQPFVVGRWGASHPRDIALTFDDGPDPRWTPQILTILRQAGVQATFFVVGLQAQANPGLLRQIVAGGHEVGAHTYTHPNLSMVSPAQVRLELDATQRLIGSVLGRGTLLFRPPFAEDVEPATPEQARVLQQASDLGYTTVGLRLDPLDWARPGTDAIVRHALAQAEAGQGHIMLLHDAGGDRAQTVAALPRIIAGLRARGDHLVTVSQLAGLTRDQVMPPVSGLSGALTRAGGWGFGLVAGVGTLMGVLFTTGILLSCLRLGFVSVLGLTEFFRRRRREPAPADLPLTVLVPAYNEARVINKTVASLLTQGDDVRVLVIDDGSADDTAGVARAAYGGHPRVQIVRTPNGGKAAALNHGLALAQTEVVVVIDADTVLAPDALRHLAGHFADSRVAAVAGNAKVGNRVNLMTRWQALEYITAQNVERRALALLNCVSVVPGAIGAWRRQVLLEVGGLATDTLAEDADLTLRVLRAGHRVTYEQRAVALTEAPDTVGGFLKQRFRWMYGILQATWKQRGALRAGQDAQRQDVQRRDAQRSRRLGLVTVPNVLIFQVVLPLISAVLDLYMLVSLLWSALQRGYHPDAQGVSAHVWGYYLLFILIDLAAAVLAFALERREDWRLLLWLPFQRLFYRQLLYLVAIRALLAALRGGQQGWGKLERKGTVQAQAELH